MTVGTMCVCGGGVWQQAVCVGNECRGYSSGHFVQERKGEGMKVGITYKGYKSKQNVQEKGWRV